MWKISTSLQLKSCIHNINLKFSSMPMSKIICSYTSKRGPNKLCILFCMLSRRSMNLDSQNHSFCDCIVWRWAWRTGRWCRETLCDVWSKARTLSVAIAETSKSRRASKSWVPSMSYSTSTATTWFLSRYVVRTKYLFCQTHHKNFFLTLYAGLYYKLFLKYSHHHLFSL